MTPDGLARTHAAAFGPDRGWPKAEFDRYLTDAHVTIFGDDLSFAVVRQLGPEAEILTLATHPDVQGQGRAKTMLAATIEALRRTGAEVVFLEVNARNVAATALYLAQGFTAFATRDDYYADGSSAVCMKLKLSPTSAV